MTVQVAGVAAAARVGQTAAATALEKDGGMTSGGMTAFIWKNRIAWLIVVVVVGVGLDQASKAWAFQVLTRPATTAELACDLPGARKHQPECRGSPRVTEHGYRVVLKDVPVVDGVFGFKYAENPAAAFSMTGSLPVWFRRPFLLLVSMIASIGIAFWYLRLKEKDWAIFTAFPLIIAGAIGNLIDRLRLAFVIDFLDVYLSAPASAVAWLVRNANTNHWPTFNIADSCIVVGALLVVFRTMKPLRPQSATAQPPVTDQPA